MKLKIAGGCGEHGRNCFFVDCTAPFLVDCGIMAGAEDAFPDLAENEIKRLRYVFLTHSHADHTGALPWLYERGFNGVVVAAAPTLGQLPFKPRYSIALNKLHDEIGGIKFAHGRSGHCQGAVWYEFSADGRKLLFSGDYTENSLMYQCDPIRGRTADIAVVDCAYGNDSRSFSECCGEIISAVYEMKKRHKTILFPVPKYGRGADLLRLFNENFPKYACCGDEHFISQLNEAADRFWFRNKPLYARLFTPSAPCDILFLSDPQLRSSSSQSVADSILADGGAAVMTGTAEHGSFSEKLINLGKMKLLRYSVHQNYSEFSALVGQNKFGMAIPYHSGEFPVNDRVIEL